MFFQPAIGAGGYAGWRVLESTEARQREIFENAPSLTRDIDYFRENISNALTAEALVNDRRLLTVALGAFGLGDEINKRAFIQRMLEEGTEQQDAFANRFNDPRYRAFSEAFGYGNITAGSSVLLTEFREDIIARYKSLEFEQAVGNVDNDMRLALNFRREIGNVAENASTDQIAWLQIMGQRPLRELVATALNIPTAAAQLDIDRQVEIFSAAAERVLGDSSPSQFTSEEVADDMIRRFFLSRQLDSGPTASTPGFAALSLFQGGLGSGAIAGLVASL